MIKDYNFYLFQVEENGKYLKDVPEKLITEEMCWQAVNSNGYALAYVPEKFKTEKMCIQAMIMLIITWHPGWKKSFYDFVPQKFKNQDFLRKALRIHGKILEIIPQELITEEMCIEAVKSYGCALYHVPKEFKTEEICLEAVKENGYALAYVPHELITEEMCWQAIKTKRVNLYYISETSYYPYWSIKVKNEKDSFANYVKEINMNIIKKKYEYYISVLAYVPKKFKTEEICLEAVKNDEKSYAYCEDVLKVPENFVYSFYSTAYEIKKQAEEQFYLFEVKERKNEQK